MFSKRKSFLQGYKFNKEFLEKLVNDFITSGFKQITVKLPHNLIKDGKDEIEIQDFVNRERNYPSVILVAKNQQNNEIIKILFINISTKAFFKDDTFPSGHSESPEIYIQGPDPARVYSLFGFFYDYITKRSKNSFISSLLGLLCIFFISAEALTFVAKKFLIASHSFNLSVWIDYLLIFISVVVAFMFYSNDSGLYIKEKDHKYLDAIKRALKGDYRDNPIINIIVTVIATITATVILKIIGII